MVGEIPRGLADTAIAPITGLSTVGSFVDVPGGRSLSFNIDQTSDDLEGDDAILAKAVSAPSLSGSFEVGKINLAAIAIWKGGTVDSEGTTPNVITSLDQSDAAEFNWFQAMGQANDAEVAGSAYRVTLKKLIAVGGPNETLEVSAWNTPTVDFEGVAISGVLLTRAQYETAAPLIGGGG